MLSFDCNRTSYVNVDVNVGIKRHNFKFPLILDKYNIMTVMQNKYIYAGIYVCDQCRMSTLQFASKTTNA